MEAGRGLVQEVWRVELTLDIKGRPVGRPFSIEECKPHFVIAP